MFQLFQGVKFNKRIVVSIIGGLGAATLLFLLLLQIESPILFTREEDSTEVKIVALGHESIYSNVKNNNNNNNNNINNNNPTDQSSNNSPNNNDDVTQNSNNNNDNNNNNNNSNENSKTTITQNANTNTNINTNSNTNTNTNGSSKIMGLNKPNLNPNINYKHISTIKYVINSNTIDFDNNGMFDYISKINFDSIDSNIIEEKYNLNDNNNNNNNNNKNNNNNCPTDFTSIQEITNYISKLNSNINSKRQCLLTMVYNLLKNYYCKNGILNNPYLSHDASGKKYLLNKCENELTSTIIIFLDKQKLSLYEIDMLFNKFDILFDTVIRGQYLFQNINKFSKDINSNSNSNSNSNCQTEYQFPMLNKANIIKQEKYKESHQSLSNSDSLTNCVDYLSYTSSEDSNSNSNEIVLRKQDIWLHLPKTGGTTIYQWLEGRFGGRFVHLWGTDALRDEMSGKGVKGRNRGKMGKYLNGINDNNVVMIGGHIPYGIHNALNIRYDSHQSKFNNITAYDEHDSFNYIYGTIVREPISRVISHYNYNNKQSRSKNANTMFINQLKLQSAAQWSKVFPDAMNVYTQMISGCYHNGWYLKDYLAILSLKKGGWNDDDDDDVGNSDINNGINSDINNDNNGKYGFNKKYKKLENLVWYKSHQVNWDNKDFIEMRDEYLRIEYYFVARYHLLEENFLWIGLTESFDRSIQHFNYLYEMKTQSNMYNKKSNKAGGLKRKSNVAHKSKKTPLNDDDRKIIEKFNKNDVYLYDTCKVLYLQIDLVISIAETMAQVLEK